jgi:hypothetical protein
VFLPIAFKELPEFLADGEPRGGSEKIGIWAAVAARCPSAGTSPAEQTTRVTFRQGPAPAGRDADGQLGYFLRAALLLYSTSRIKSQVERPGKFHAVYGQGQIADDVRCRITFHRLTLSTIEQERSLR